MSLDTTPDDIGRLLARHPGAVVVVEACANAGWVHHRAAAAGHPVTVANTAAESWKFTHLKRKTDRCVATHIRNVYDKLGVHTRSQAVAKAVRENFG